VKKCGAMAAPLSKATRAWPYQVQRFVWGLTRPFQLLDRLRAEPVAWRAYVRTVAVQAAVTLALGSVLFVRDLSKRPQAAEEVQEARAALASAQREQAALLRVGVERPAVKARGAAREASDAAAAAVALALAHLDEAKARARAARRTGARDDAAQEVTQARARLEEARARARAAHRARAAAPGSPEGEGPGGTPPGPPAPAVAGADEAPAALQAALEAARVAAQAAPGSAGVEASDADVDAATEDAQARLEEARDEVRSATEKLAEAEAEASSTWWRTLGLWLSSLVAAQWVVVGLSRDFQDRVARDLSLVAALQPEDVPPWTRVRLDVKWLWRKVRRRLRGALALAAGVALLSPLILVGAVLGVREQATSVVVSLVSAYWWVVFTAARSARAWRFEADPTPPWPLRVLLDGSETVPLLRWWLPRLVTRLARRATASMAAPGRAVEADFAAFAGLGVARLVATVPLVRVALRAAVVVAAGEALEASIPLGPELMAPRDGGLGEVSSERASSAQELEAGRLPV
jgi:hypothetical protein